MNKQQRNLDFSYFNENRKKVDGSAAFNHYVYTIKGGIQEYNDEVGKAYIEDYIKHASDRINAKIERNARKSNFKVG